jgi:hypothetical protein
MIQKTQKLLCEIEKSNIVEENLGKVVAAPEKEMIE